MAQTRIYTTRYKQSAYDLAIQLYGDLSKIGIILKNFPNLDTDVPVGSQFVVEQQLDPIAVYFSDRNLIVSTGELVVRDIFDDTFDETFD